MSAIEIFKEAAAEYLSDGDRRFYEAVGLDFSATQIKQFLAEIEQLEAKVAALEKDRDKWRLMAARLYGNIPKTQEHMHDNVQGVCQEYRDMAKEDA